MSKLPRILITMGDVAGIGPEIIAKAWPELHGFCVPVFVGDPDSLLRALALVNSRATVRTINQPHDAEPHPDLIPCISGSREVLGAIEIGKVSAAAGKAAFDFLCQAIDLTLSGEADAIVTAPIHKDGLRAAGLPYPGHTEILADRCGVKKYAMLLHGRDLSVIHVTLHMALRDIFQHLTTESIYDKIQLLHGWLLQLLEHEPRLGVAALNPHASDAGLFGDEEARCIEPAVTAARRERLNVTGPWPCDTLFVRARNHEFDGIVAMYHDQGHIAMKLLGIDHLVNVTLGLPLIRTSVAHGTAYDIAGRGVANYASLVEAARLASQLVNAKANTRFMKAPRMS